ncbi:MAG: OmpA family protein [Bacteroidia bacterium]|nr:OmpA family protein [Bacteroidia bacterium]
MKNLRLLLLLTILCSVPFVSNGQEKDKNKYKKKDQEQLEMYEDGDYLFPPQPRNNWSIGLKGGLAFVSGDVKMRPGYAAGLDVRKALGHAFSLRLQATGGQAYGQNYQPTYGYRNHAGNPWAEEYYPGGNNVVPGSSELVPQVYYNFQMTYADVSLQGVLNLNNINFYKEQTKWNIYLAFGAGGMMYHTRVDLKDANDELYTHFTEVTAQPLNDSNNPGVDGRRARLDILSSRQDGVYETPAEGHSDEEGFVIGERGFVINPQVNVGFGIRYRLGRRVEIELEHRLATATDDLLDGQRWQENGGGTQNGQWASAITPLTRDFDSYNHTTLGLHFRLGPGEDAAWWSNPLTEIYSNAQESRQLVKKLTDDSDNDGVPDLYDKEPDTPENTPVDNQGRTLDSDGDGYPDIEDDEPFSLKGCNVDNNGVMIDADNDGTPDCIDKEPNSPPGHYYDANGVAIIMNDPGNNNSTSNANVPCLLPIIHFDLNRDEIKPEFYPELYYIAQVMKNDKEVKVRAIGHTDNRNTDAYNEDLSKRRVDNAVNFLVNTYGIDRGRFLTGYEGEKKTLIKNLADNHNPKLEPLHYVNRRVEFECVRE